MIVSILERVRQKVDTLPEKLVKNLLKLKLVDYIFKDFEDQRHFEREESEYARRLLKDNTGNEIEGISRRDVERLVYAKRATCL